MTQVKLRGGRKGRERERKREGDREWGRDRQIDRQTDMIEKIMTPRFTTPKFLVRFEPHRRHCVMSLSKTH